MAARLSDDLALRIGLAGRALGENGLHRLMPALLAHCGLPLSAAALAALNIGDLRRAAGGLLGELPRQQLREALGYLRGTTPIAIVDALPPPLQAYADGDMPGSLRIAVTAGEGGENIAGSFSRCPAFLIYQVSASEIRLIDRRQPPPGKARQTLAARAALLADCALLYAAEIGNAAAAAAMRAGLHPVRASAGSTARAQFQALQQVLARHPPPWLARAMAGAEPSRPVVPGKRLVLVADNALSL